MGSRGRAGFVTPSLICFFYSEVYAYEEHKVLEIDKADMEGIPVLGAVLRLYEEGKSTRDPRTKDLPFLSDNPVYVWLITATYLAFVQLGPRIMKDRPALHFPKFMVIYNSSLVILSIYMFVEIIASAVYADYFTEKPLCCVYNSETPKNPKEMRITKVLYIYFLSKIVELMDTVMMVLRKKFDQVTFLHVLHHSSMLNIWWWVMVYIPGGQSWLSSSVNSFVHIVMYLYYALAAIPACRPYLWWKKYITKLQLMQFFIILYHTLQTGFTGCDFPMWSQILLTSYMLLLIVLFGNFYIQAYIKKKREYNRKQESTERNGFISNGTNGKVSNGHHYHNGVPNGHSSDILKKEN